MSDRGTPSAAGTQGKAATSARDGLTGPAQVVLVTDQPALAELIGLTLERTVPRLMILDLYLERMDGARVLERIGFPTLRAARVAVIALTRRGDLKTRLAAFDLGATTS